jgi:aryl-alcohol dehydrogenase-like predicted oxidoreductase
MRLSTDPARDENRAITVLHAAFDAGIFFIDTADAYALDASDVGHNERLIARARDSWDGDRSRIVIATKGGLTRPQGSWVPDGRARHLEAACEASLRALGVDRIHLYQLHAPDPRTPFATGVRALAALQRAGLVRHLGLCNVTVAQIEEARSIADIASVQIELSIWHDDNILNGVAKYCVDHDLTLIAHRPLGGAIRRRRPATDPIIEELAARHAATPAEIALAWVRSLSPAVVPIPGATRVETVRSIARAQTIALTRDDRALMDERFPSAVALHPDSRPSGRPSRSDGEVVLIMGLPAAGKSTVAADFVSRGYRRLNRDATGGTLASLLPALDRVLASGDPRVVLDNTYVSRVSRARVIEAARRRDLAVRCVWLQTGLEDAQVNAVSRMMARYGRLLPPEELRGAARADPGVFGPSVQFRYERALEPPRMDEGFSHIDVMTFERRRDPSLDQRALIVWCDNVVHRSRAGRRAPADSDDVEVLAGRGPLLRRYADEGWKLLGLSWQPELGNNPAAREGVDRAFARLQRDLGVEIDVLYCPHDAGPPVCWCRKPLPGLGVLFIERHRLDASRCLYVGSGVQDPGFARRLGFQYADAADFFNRGSTSS